LTLDLIPAEPSSGWERLGSSQSVYQGRDVVECGLLQEAAVFVGRPQHGLDIGPEGGIVRAGLVEEDPPVLRFDAEHLLEELLEILPALGAHHRLLLHRYPGLTNSGFARASR
jgi:hypothetical protein